MQLGVADNRREGGPLGNMQSTQQPGTQQPDEDTKRKGSKAKEAGNVPRSDDDVGDETSEGTREDGAGTGSRNS